MTCKIKNSCLLYKKGIRIENRGYKGYWVKSLKLMANLHYH